MTFRNMRNTVLMALVLLTGLTMQAHAETSIAVVDVEAILSQSLAAKSVQKQVTEKRSSFLSEVKKAEDKLRSEEDKLRTEQQSIQKNPTEAAEKAFTQKVQDFEKRKLDTRSSLQKKKATLDKSYSTAMNTLTKSIFEVCQTIAAEQKIDLILTKQNIIVGTQSLNITATVMESLDKKLPKLSLK